jgi:CRP-like cAMP-binding protein
MFHGMSEDDLAQIARVLRPRDVAAGEVLWRQGEHAVGMLLVVDGLVSIMLRLPGERSIEVGALGPGEPLGETPLIDGGNHTMTAQVAQPGRLLSLSAADFAALLSRGHPLALSLSRRLGRVLCSRLRLQLASLAGSLGDDSVSDPAGEASLPRAELEPSGPPNSGYVSRLATFHAFDPLALFRFLTSGRYVQCPGGRVLLTAGEASPGCYLTMNGVIEKIIIRGGRRIRVGLAGPGQAVGYESLIDGGPAAVTALTRERTRLLALSRDAFDRLFETETVGSHAFLEMINREIVIALRQILRAQARLAASVTPQQASRGGRSAGTSVTSMNSVANVMKR